MTFIENKEKLFDAIDQNPFLTKNPKKILKILCLYEKPVPVKSLVDSSSLPKQIVYPCLDRMVKSRMVLKSKNDNDVYYSYEVNKTTLREILELYEKTLLIKKSL